MLSGLVLSAAMVARSQVKGDQLNLLARGWLLAFRGEWVPFGNPLSGGGKVPGGLTSLLVGAPLELWPHHRAPVVLVLLSHVAAYWMLDRLAVRLLGSEARLPLAVLYWLNPSRLYLSGFLWNPGMVVPFAVVHFWSLERSRVAPRFAASLLHAVAIGLAAQLHPAALVLAAASLLLWAKGLFRPHWGGLLVGSALVALSLVPWWRAVAGTGGVGAATPAFAEALWRAPYSMLRALLYWLRLPSLSASHAVYSFDFAPLLGAEERIGEALSEAAETVGFVSVALPLWAVWRLWRRRRPAASAADDEGRTWLVATLRWHVVALVAVAALSPITLQWFHLVIVLPGAALAVVLALLPELREGEPRLRRRPLLAAWGVAAVLLGLAMAAGSPLYRCGGVGGGRQGTLPALRGDHPMLDDLGIRKTCPPAVDDPEGWWMDVLPEPRGRPPRPNPDAALP